MNWGELSTQSILLLKKINEDGIRHITKRIMSFFFGRNYRYSFTESNLVQIEKDNLSGKALLFKF